jgi:uncharacterized protein (TIGR00255 family)
LAEAAVRQLRGMAEATGLEAAIQLRDVLLLPGVCRVETAPVPEETATRLVTAAGREALAEFDKSRLAEGAHLANSLAGNIAELTGLLDSMAARQDEVLQRYRDRLLERIGLLEVEVKLDDERLAKEVAFAAQRSDVAEELTRIDSHLNQFRQLCAAGDQPVGRQLQFICQEIHREINTLCSKASETATAREGIHFKTILEKVREQIANVE